jgi:hypothetical protein
MRGSKTISTLAAALLAAVASTAVADAAPVVSRPVAQHRNGAVCGAGNICTEHLVASRRGPDAAPVMSRPVAQHRNGAPCVAGHVCEEHVVASRRAVDDPPDPDQPADFVITISNFCNTTMTLSSQDFNLWEGNYTVVPPNTIASEMSSNFKYGMEVQADAGTNRLNGTFIYENPFLYVDFFAVDGEWGVMVEASPQAKANILQADVGVLSVYSLFVGFGQTC